MHKVCKDCIHYDACKDMYDGIKEDFDDKVDVGSCEFFKGKDRFIELPCAVGDTVYRVISDKRVKHPHECKVIGYWYSEDEPCSRIHLVRHVNGVFDYSMSVPLSDFDKHIFLTKEDAEKALSKELDYVEAKDFDKESPEFKRAMETLKRL